MLTLVHFNIADMSSLAYLEIRFYVTKNYSNSRSTFKNQVLAQLSLKVQSTLNQRSINFKIKFQCKSKVSKINFQLNFQNVKTQVYFAKINFESWLFSSKSSKSVANSFVIFFFSTPHQKSHQHMNFWWFWTFLMKNFLIASRCIQNPFQKYHT